MAAHSRSAGGRPKELPKVLTKDQVEALMAAPNLSVPTGLRDRCIMQLMHRAGLRVSETVHAPLRGVLWKEAKIHLPAAITKGKVEAYLPLDDPTLALLERWKFERRRYGAGMDELFTTLRGTPVSRKSVWAMMQRRGRKVGIDLKLCHPHILRHTFATELLREGASLRQVQTLMRHADPRTTTIYTHIDDVELADLIRRRVA